MREINEKFKKVEVKYFLINQKVNPAKVGEQNQFQTEDIQKIYSEIDELDISILVNNINHATGGPIVSLNTTDLH